LFYLSFTYTTNQIHYSDSLCYMSARSDSAGLAGYGPNGQVPGPHDSGEPAMQQLQTSRAKVDYDQCLKRINEAKAIEDPSRVIGGASVGLQNFDARTNLYKTDIALVYLGDTDDRNFDYMGQDGRPTVFSSLAGMVVPQGVQSDTEFRRMLRPIGFTLLDSLVENARTGQAPHYGNTIVTGGSMGGNLHVVPEKIGAGEWLWVDVGPRTNEARQEWKKNFRFNRTTMTAASEKPVLRPFNPYGGYESLSDGFSNAIIAGLTGQNKAMYLNPSKNGVDSAALDSSIATGVAMKEGILGAVWMGVVLLQRHGYLTLNATPAVLTNDYDKTKFNLGSMNLRQELAERLGLVTDAKEDPILSNLIAGACWQPFADDDQFADAVDIKDALASNVAYRIQNESTVRLVAAVTDAFYENVSRIVAKSTKNSKQGGHLEYTVCT